MSKIVLKQICKIINDKTGIDASQLLTMSKEDLAKESRVELLIRDILSQSTLSRPERNAFNKSLTKTFFTTIRNSHKPDGYVTLTEYVQKLKSTGSFIRESEIKKLLMMNDYLVKNYATGKSYRYGYVHTQLITYQLRGRARSKEILKFWKESFLDNLLKKSSHKFEECRNQFSYTRARSNSESLNAIKRSVHILIAENPEMNLKPPTDEKELLLFVKGIVPNSERMKSLLNYLRSHLNYRVKKRKFD